MFSVSGATFNSFREQPGFCFLQGYDTISRETSGMRSPMFLDGRVWSQVGLSNAQFNNSIRSCGTCLKIHQMNIREFDPELTTWSAETSQMKERIVIVADQCKDAICSSGWLDFDVYSENFPENPTGIQWSFVPCPVLPHEDISLLFCPSKACQRGFQEEREFGAVVQESSSYFWTLYAQNLKYPLESVKIEFNDSTVSLEDTNGWMYRFDKAFDFFSPFRATLCAEKECLEVWINLSQKSKTKTTPGYRGGLLVGTGIQFN